MLILFDHSTPAPLRYALKGHVVVEAIGLPTKTFGISKTWRAGEWRSLFLAQWPVLRRYADRVLAAVNAATPGSYAEVEIPFA